MRLRFYDKPVGTLTGDVFPRATAIDLSQLNLRNADFWNPPAPVTRQAVTDTTGSILTLQQWNQRNEAYWRRKS